MNLGRPAQNAGNPPRRVVSMVYLSERLPADFLTGQTAAMLQAETGSPVLVVRIVPPHDVLAGEALLLPHLFRDGLPQLPDPLPQSADGLHHLTLCANGELYPSEWIVALVERLRNRFHYVLIQAVADRLVAPTLFEFILRSDLGNLFLSASTEDVYQLDLLMRELRPQVEASEAAIKPVLCLAEGETVAGYEDLIEEITGRGDFLVRDCPKLGMGEPLSPGYAPTKAFRSGIRRLAREIGNCLVGLALSSGGAKGLSHIGVVQVLEENGIEVDVIAGASMGAYVGAIWACGFDGEKMEQLARELEPRWALWSLLDPVFPPRQGFLRGLAVKRRLMRSIGNVRFGDLLRPMRIVAANLETLERVVFSTGEVATAVHASAAVPGICVPVTINGESYVDGGIVDPLPVDVLREMGVARIIAVNAIPTSDRIRYCLQAEREFARLTDTKARQTVRKLFPVEEKLNYFARGNILDILMRSIHGAQIRMAEALSRRADLVLYPTICEDRWVDFRHPDKFILPGRKAAERHLAEIKALVAPKGSTHERSTTIPSVAAVA